MKYKDKRTGKVWTFEYDDDGDGETVLSSGNTRVYIPYYEFIHYFESETANRCDCGADSAGINAQGGQAHAHYCSVYYRGRK